MQTALKTTAVALLIGASSLCTPVAAQTYTPAPSPSASAMPSDNASSTPQSPTMTTMPQSTTAPSSPDNGNHKGQIKQLKTATMSFVQVAYALTHQASEIKQLRAMKKVSFDNVHVVKLSSAFKTRLHIHVDSGEQTVAMDDPFMVQDAMMVAQTNGSNSPIANLQYVLANINVSNALNNVLNGSNVSVNASLADVLNANKIGIGQVLGMYVHGFSIINTIIK